MKIAVHLTKTSHDLNYAKGWINELEKRNIKFWATDFKAPDFANKIKRYDGAMWHWFHEPDDKQSAPKILDSIEFGLKIPVFPNFMTRYHFDEKISQYYFLQSIDAPIVKTWIFWHKEEAEDFIKSCNYPLIYKMSVGAGSANILKIDSKEKAQKVIDQMFGSGVLPYTMNEFQIKDKVKNSRALERLKQVTNYILKNRHLPKEDKLHWYYTIQKNYILFQEYLPNPFDIRITIIGNRAFAFTRNNRSDDFRASGSGKINYDLKRIPLKAVKIAHETSEKQGFQSMAYDFLFDQEKNLKICEISYGYMSQAVYDCGGYWDRDLKWHPGHILPEKAHVEDFIYYIKNRKSV